MTRGQAVQNILSDVKRFGRASFVSVMSEVIVRWSRRNRENPVGIADEIARKTRTIK